MANEANYHLCGVDLQYEELTMNAKVHQI